MLTSFALALGDRSIAAFGKERGQRSPPTRSKPDLAEGSLTALSGHRGLRSREERTREAATGRQRNT